MYLKCVNHNYSFRYAIPKDVRPYFFRSELIVSLKTKDLKIAKVKSLKLAAELKALIESLRLMVALNMNEMHHTVEEWLKKTIGYYVKYQSVDDRRLTYAVAIEKYLRYFHYKTSSNDEYEAISSFFNHGFKIVMGENNFIANTLDECVMELEDLARLPKMSPQKIRAGIKRKELLDLDNNISTSTYSKYIKWSKAFYQWAFNNGYTSTNIASGIKRVTKSNAKEQRSQLSDLDVHRLLALAKLESTDLYTMVKILAYSGIRNSEFFKMEVQRDYFDLTNRSLNLKTSNSYRIVPRHIKLQNISDKYIRDLQTKYDYRYLTKQGMKLIRRITNDKSRLNEKFGLLNNHFFL